MLKKLLYMFICAALFGEGGYDHATAVDKNNLRFSITLNPLNYYPQGQSYIIARYGLTNSFNIHGYYSTNKEKNDNYYAGIIYQFYTSRKVDLSTAIGIRKYTRINNTHIFLPQLLITLKLNENYKIGGSLVNIRNIDIINNLGTSFDIFLLKKLFQNEKYKLDFTLGVFKPALWDPLKGDWHPTYSIELTLF